MMNQKQIKNKIKEDKSEDIIDWWSKFVCGNGGGSHCNASQAFHRTVRRQKEKMRL